MNKTLKLILMLTFSHQFASLAETESFDMALTGDFQNDFCTLLLGTVLNNDINTSKNLGSDAIVATQSVDVMCSAGTRTVIVNNTETSHYEMLDSNTMMKQEVIIAPFHKLTLGTYQNSSGISSSRSAIYNDVVFDGVNSLELIFSSTIRVIDGDWNNTINSYNKTYTAIITIN